MRERYDSGEQEGKMRQLFPILMLLSATLWGGIIEDVRASIAAKDFQGGQRQIAAYQASKGVTGELALAASWLGRGALALKE